MIYLVANSVAVVLFRSVAIAASAASRRRAVLEARAAAAANAARLPSAIKPWAR